MKKAQIGDTLTWVIAFLIIVFLLFMFLSFSGVLATNKILKGTEIEVREQDYFNKGYNAEKERITRETINFLEKEVGGEDIKDKLIQLRGSSPSKLDEERLNVLKTEVSAFFKNYFPENSYGSVWLVYYPDEFPNMFKSDFPKFMQPLVFFYEKENIVAGDIILNMNFPRGNLNFCARAGVEAVQVVIALDKDKRIEVCGEVKNE